MSPVSFVLCFVCICLAHFSDFMWSLSNDIILSVSYDGTARLWNVASGKCIRVIQDQTGAELHACMFHPLNNNMFVVSFSLYFRHVVKKLDFVA